MTDAIPTSAQKAGADKATSQPDQAASDQAPEIRKPCIYVCTTCAGIDSEDNRSGVEYDKAGEPRPGTRFHADVMEAAENIDDIEVVGVTCLGNCQQGCSAALAQPGKWGYLLGHLTPDLGADLVAYAQAYGQSKSGMVPRKNRPASMGSAIMSRFPVPAPAPEMNEAFRNKVVGK